MYDDDDPLNCLHPTVVWPSGWTAVCGQEILPLAPECYRVVHTTPWWSIVLDPEGEVVYRGFGPVKVIRSPAPF